jgi:hypothetical protein
MAKRLYCWRCKTDIPMLEEHEWAVVLPRLYEGIRKIREYRSAQDATLEAAKRHVYEHGALERYFEITGFRETNINALWHHRLSLFGPPCNTCGKPLRTPRAKLCAECGAAVSR